MSETKYTISVPDSAVEQLNQHLDNNIWVDQIEPNDDWQYGSPLSDVKRLAEYWRHKFNWRTAEAKLNELPNYVAKVEVKGHEPLDIHYIHQKSTTKDAVPLLFVHGWPGSVYEATKLLPLLAGGKDGAPAFHVVVPSLPNFGFSGKVKKGGFGLEQYAECLHKLMIQLGYDEYVTQGGDWGFMITRTIGAMYPKHCKGSHINLIIAAPPTFTQNPLYALRHMLTPYTDAEKAGLARTAWFRGSGTGYSALQTTKPQTLGYGLASSPVFLLAWIYEKLHDWTDSYPWTDEEICTWISIYWFSAAGPAASVRIYYEVTHIPTPTLEKMSGGKHGWNAMSSLKTPQVPLGLARFPKELGVFPKVWTYPLGNVVYESESKDGGHFAAWEKPDVIAADLQKMFGKGGPCFGAVKGRNGY